VNIPAFSVANYCRIINDHEARNKEIAYKKIPEVRRINNAVEQRNYLQIKQDVQEIIQEVMERLLSNPAMMHLVIRK
jgi:hypothetical protein